MLAPQQIPVPASIDSLSPDAVDFIPAGSTAEQIIADPLSTISARLYGWVLEGYAELVYLSPLRS